MTSRKHNVEELLEGFMSLKHRTAFSARGSARSPRITPSQWGVVMYIRAHASCTLKDVARTFSITSSAATQLVDGLVKSGYVTRTMDPHDRRAIALDLSAKTRTHVEAMKRAAVKDFLKVFEVLSQKEFEQYCALSKKLTRASVHAPHTSHPRQSHAL